MSNNVIKGIKGFNKDMKCRDFQYEEGKEFTTERAKCCDLGFHFCENPMDVFSYYGPASSVFHEVEGSGDIYRQGDDSKVACTRIKIGARLTIPALCKLAFEYVRSRCTNECNAEPGKPATAGYKGAATAGYKGAATAGNYGAATSGDGGAATAGDSGAATAGNYGAATAGNYGAATAGDSGAATAGNYGAATAGNYGAATAGDKGAATAGNYGAATAGNYGAATAGYKGAATAGDKGAATAGNYGAATAGYKGAATAGYKGAATAGNYGAATAGNYGAATSRGSSSTGDNGLSVARGNNVKVRGGMGAILVICEEFDDNYNPKDWAMAVVDGTNIKADTWYHLVDGKFVEVPAEEVNCTD